VAGVWDKGGEPSGINLGDSIMADEDKVPAWADALVKRFDAFEAKEKERADAEEKKEKERADAAEAEKAKLKGETSEEAEKVEKEEKRADAEEEKKREEEKADSAKIIAGMAAQIEALNAKLQPLSNADRDALSVAQAKADRVAQMFGDSVNAPLYGESPIAYRKRLAEKFKAHSKDFAEIKLDALDGATFDIVEAKIYADAQTVALAPATGAGRGRLMPIVTKENGREITRYAGDPMAWMAPFISPSVGIAINKGAK
jgi:flagellar biosynthesis GTPase FlhF